MSLDIHCLLRKPQNIVRCPQRINMSSNESWWAFEIVYINNLWFIFSPRVWTKSYRKWNCIWRRSRRKWSTWRTNSKSSWWEDKRIPWYTETQAASLAPVHILFWNSLTTAVQSRFDVLVTVYYTNVQWLWKWKWNHVKRGLCCRQHWDSKSLTECIYIYLYVNMCVSDWWMKMLICKWNIVVFFATEVIKMLWSQA